MGAGKLFLPRSDYQCDCLLCIAHLFLSPYRHRIAAILDFARYIITLLKLVKAFTGPYEVVPGFVAQEVLLIGVGAAMAWQALTMTAVDARAGDADEDEE